LNPRIRGSSDTTSTIRPSEALSRSLPGTRLHTLLSATPLSPWARRRLSSLARESHSEIFWSDLLSFGRAAEGAGELSLSLAVYQEISRSDPEAGRREAAERAAAALRGVGVRAGDRLEYLSYGFLSQATDPALLLGMTGAGLGYRGGRALSAKLLRRWGVEESFGAWGLKSFSALGGFGVEVPAFVMSEKLGRGLMGEAVRWEGKAWVEELGGAALVLGALKLGGWGSGALLRRWPLGAAGVPWGGREFYLGATRYLPPVGMYGGILLGQDLAGRWRGEVEARDGWVRLLDGGVTLLQFQATAGLLQRLSPGGSGKWSLDSTNFPRKNFLSSRPAGCQWDWAGQGPAAIGGNRGVAGRMPFVFMSENGDEGPPRRRVRYLWQGKLLSPEEFFREQALDPQWDIETESSAGRELFVTLPSGKRVLLLGRDTVDPEAENWTLVEIRYKKLILIPTREIGREDARRLEITRDDWREFRRLQGKQFDMMPFVGRVPEEP